MTDETTATMDATEKPKGEISKAEAAVMKAEETVGTTLLKALLTEVQRLQKPWQNTPQKEQQDVIDRLRIQVESAVSHAVHAIAGAGSTSLMAQVESVTFKDGVKCVLKLGRGNAAVHELADAEGGHVMVIMMDTAQHTGGMGQVKATPDQPGLFPPDPPPADTQSAQQGAGDASNSEPTADSVAAAA